MLHFDPKTYHKHKKASKKQVPSFLDKIVLIASVVYPLGGVPQVISVFSGNANGVSLLSWALFMLCASLFLAYGIKHRVVPMVVSNVIWIGIDGLVILGILIEKTS